MSPNQLAKQSARGFSLPLVLILTGVLVVATSAFLAEIVGSSRAGYMLMKRKQAFYVADGISRVVGRSAQTKLNAMEPSDRTALLNDPVALEQKILDLICEEGNGPSTPIHVVIPHPNRTQTGAALKTCYPNTHQPYSPYNVLKLQCLILDRVVPSPAALFRACKVILWK